MNCFSCGLKLSRNRNIYRAWDNSFCTNCYYKYNDIINDEKYDWGKDSKFTFETVKKEIELQIEKKNRNENEIKKKYGGDFFYQYRI